MAILVDHMHDVKRGGHWPYRRAAHMVSTKSFAELHEFASSIGLTRAWFQGDHYDITTQKHLLARDAGAEEVHARDLISRMKRSEGKHPNKIIKDAVTS